MRHNTASKIKSLKLGEDISQSGNIKMGDKCYDRENAHCYESQSES